MLEDLTATIDNLLSRFKTWCMEHRVEEEEYQFYDKVVRMAINTEKNDEMAIIFEPWFDRDDLLHLEEAKIKAAYSVIEVCKLIINKRHIR